MTLAFFLVGLVTSATGGPSVGSPAPPFEAPATGGKSVKLADLKGQWVVLYFYPKSFTPGCTKEACSLRDGYPGIQETGAVILGVSTDALETQEKFKAEYALPFDLLADAEKAISRAYDVLAPGGLFAQRKTFIIDPAGQIAHVFENVDPAGHEAQVRQVLEDLRKAR